jgi:nicotinic acid mononucleotide adenylyltransferase
MIRDWNGEIEIIRDIPKDILAVDATMVRDNILHHKEWRDLVPAGTASVIEQYDLEKRVREAVTWSW